MKRIILALAVMLAGGAVWGQVSVPDAVNPFDHSFDAREKTLSTEARYSAGLFSSDVDDYIDASWYDPEVNNFVFLGGYPSIDTEVDTTDVITPSQYAISVGLAKKFGFGYMAFYYGGSFVNANGSKVSDEPLAEQSSATWNNNLAVLFGMGNMGFRFDLTGAGLGTDTTTIDPVDAKKSETTTVTNGPGIALSWGAKMGNIVPGVQIGFKFPNTTYYEDGDGKNSTISQGAIFALGGDIWMGLSDAGSVYAALGFATMLAESYAGDKAVLGYDPYEQGGSWGIDLYLHYQHELTFGKVGVKARPHLGVNFVSVSHNSTASGAPDMATDDYLSFELGFDLGLKFQYSEKIAFYTGASLDLFKWNFLSHAGGDKDKNTTNESNEWDITGIQWAGRRWTGSSTLGVGMTLTPAEGLVFGFGLNTFLDKIVEIDLEQMQVRSGSFWNNSGAANLGDWVTNLFRDLTFDLTISYKF